MGFSYKACTLKPSIALPAYNAFYHKTCPIEDPDHCDQQIWYRNILEPTSFCVWFFGQEGLQERQRGGLQGVALAVQQALQVRAQLTEQAGQVLCPAGQRAQRH